MSHLHIPDGVLPWWLILVGWIATGTLLTIAQWRIARGETRRRIPLVGSVAALMLVAMSSEIVPIAYHINLSVLAGIMLGPWLSAFAAFVVVTMLALLGHGGITVIGLNTLIISAEMIVGWALIRWAVRVFGARHLRLQTWVATVATLALSTTLVIVIVALGGAPAATRESGAFDPGTLRFENPLAGGFLGNALFEAPQAAAEKKPALPIGRFALVLYTLGSIGWVIEAFVTAGIVGFVARVRPSLIDAELPSQHPKPPGDEGVHG